MESQQSRDSPGTQPHIAPQQPKSGPTHKFATPPPETFDPRPSSHIYVTNGEPTVRPVVGWQFKKMKGKTRVWSKGRWRKLIQNRRDFQGLRVDMNGWIMPVLDPPLSEIPWGHVRDQAKVEFNSHP